MSSFPIKDVDCKTQRTHLDEYWKQRDGKLSFMQNKVQFYLHRHNTLQVKINMKRNRMSLHLDKGFNSPRRHSNCKYTPSEYQLLWFKLKIISKASCTWMKTKLRGHHSWLAVGRCGLGGWGGSLWEGPEGFISAPDPSLEPFCFQTAMKWAIFLLCIPLTCWPAWEPTNYVLKPLQSMSQHKSTFSCGQQVLCSRVEEKLLRHLCTQFHKTNTIWHKETDLKRPIVRLYHSHIDYLEQ